MIDNEALKYFIHEELFILKESTSNVVNETNHGTLADTTEELPHQTNTRIQDSPTSVSPSVVEEPAPAMVTKHDLVVVLERSQSDQDKDLLTKLIPAIGKSYSSTKFIMAGEMETVKFNYLIVFGSSALVRELSLNHINKSTSTQRGKIIFTSSMDDLHQNKQAKGQFWLGLKEMFEIA